MCIQSLHKAVLIVCSTDGFLELFRSWPVATAISLYLTPGQPKVSCDSLVDMYLGKRSASVMKEFCNFCNFCNLVMTVSETIIVEISPYSKIGLTPLFRDVQNCLFVGLVHTFD